jgi:hypothetical protein
VFVSPQNKSTGAFDAVDEKLCTMLAHHVAVFFRQLTADAA